MDDMEMQFRNAFLEMINAILINQRKSRSYFPGVRLFPSEIHLIDCVGSSADTSITALATIFGVSKGAMSKQVTRLEKKKLLERYQAGDNRKTVLVRLTELGKTAYDAHLAFHANQDEKYLNAFNSYSKEQKKLIVDFIMLYAETLEEYHYPNESDQKEGKAPTHYLPSPALGKPHTIP